MKRIIIILFLTINTLALSQSENRKEAIGTITFKSSQNVYVKFDNTSGIKVGDTLFIKENNKLLPVIVVKYISLHSAAGNMIDGRDLKIDDKVYLFTNTSTNIGISAKDSLHPFINGGKSIINSTPVYLNEDVRVRKNYSGRFSIQSFSNTSNFTNSGNYQQWRYTLSFISDSISGSPVSISNYIVFTYKNGDMVNFNDDISQNLKIYDLAANYKFNKNSSLWLGRHINLKVSNIGSIDGFQYEQSFSPYYAGIIAGSRPDFQNMGFNIKLFEYGGYFGRSDTVFNSFMENTIAVMQQTNNFKTDRRFLYFQHTNNLIPEINIFFSSEVDLFKKVLQVNENTFSLTGLFISASYRPGRMASFSLSYDARKDVIYYETFKSFADSLIDHETRQGFRASVNLHPVNQLFIGFSAGYRFQRTDPKPSRNFNGIITYGSIPLIEASPSISYTRILSSYIDGTIFGFALSKYLFDLINVSLNYNHNQYKFLYGDLQQNILSTDISAGIWKQFFLSLSYEGTFEKHNTWGRFLLDLTTRF